MLLLAFLLAGCKNYCPTTKIVKAVGGCNKLGHCGVMYEDGYSEEDVRQPVVGQTRTVYVPCPKEKL